MRYFYSALALHFRYSFVILLGAYSASLPATAQRSLSLEQAVSVATTHDLWLQTSQLTQSALGAKSHAVGAMPSPQVSVSMQNLPVDTFRQNQEAMTQLKLGVSQKFPRGDVLSLQQSRLRILSNQHPLLREDRQAQVQVTVSELWLEAYLAQKTIELIAHDKTLFEQMVEITQANYASTSGQTRQHDVIRSQLELVQLEDRLTAQYEKLETSLAMLSQWVYPNVPTMADESIGTGMDAFEIEDTLPSISLIKDDFGQNERTQRQLLIEHLMHHPALLAVDQTYKASKTSIEISKQQYKAQWGVNASYGYRQDSLAGDNRADLFSIGITFDVPLFSRSRQDQLVSASVAEAQAVKTQKRLKLRQMLSQAESLTRRLHRLKQRQTLYQTQLLAQTHEHAEASLTAYTHDDGDFAEVVRSRMVELTTQIASLRVDIDVLKTKVRLNYFFTQRKEKY